MDISERNNGSDANDEKLEVADGEAGDGEQGRSGGKKPKMAQTPRCQVEKCKEALSKDYYRRHRVCELHSKARKVLLLGFEQRFCQQCSRKWRSGTKSGDYRIKGRSNEGRSWQKKRRSVPNDKSHLFHSLAEFDEAKRSCRRRLAGHNERRRKIPSDSSADRLDANAHHSNNWLTYGGI